MPHPTRRAVLGTATLSPLALLPATGAQAQAAWPDRPLRYIVPFAPAGITDMMARLLAQQLTDRLGRPVVVENRPGGAAMIGADAAAKAPPDGYTLLAITLTHAVNASLVPNPPFDLLRAFSAIAILGAVPLVAVVRRDSSYATLGDLVAATRTRPMSVGTPGSGSPPHLALELIRQPAGAGGNLTHVPYRGGGPVVTDLVAGTLDFAVPNLPECMPQIQAGLLRALAVTGPARHRSLPDVPTAAEAGLPALAITNWTAVLTNAGTPAVAMARLATETQAAMRDPALVRRAEEAGFDVLGWDPARSGAFLREEVERWARLVAEAGIQGET